MKALTLWQPWAALIADGIKRYETRSWKTNHRGPLAIHSAKSKEGVHVALPPFIKRPHPLKFGMVLCIVDLVDCHKVEDLSGKLTETDLATGDFSAGRYAWELKLMKVLMSSQSFKGQQGSWNWPCLGWTHLKESFPEEGSKVICLDGDDPTIGLSLGSVQFGKIGDQGNPGEFFCSNEIHYWMKDNEANLMMDEAIHNNELFKQGRMK